MSGCRIGRVRMKNGGADVRVLARPVHDRQSTLLLEYARAHAVGSAPMSGFLLITWDKTGGYQASGDITADCVVPLTLMPSWIAEMVRREFVTSRQVRDVIDRGYVPPVKP